MSRLTKYLGLHAPESNSYPTGGLDAWAAAFGASPDDTRGAPLAFKRRDTLGFWTGGLAPPLPADKVMLVSEAAYWQYDIYSHWIPFTDTAPLVQSEWTSDKHSNLMNSARAVGASYPGTILFNNKRSGANFTGGASWYAEIYAEIGAIFTGMGKPWGYVDDEGPAEVLKNLPGLTAAFDAHGAVPTCIAFHAYGDTDWDKKHQKIIADGIKTLMGRNPPVIFHQECHWGFIPFGGSRGAKADVYSMAGGSYCGMMCEANAAAGIVTGLFTLEDFFEQIPGSFIPTDSLKGLVAWANGDHSVAPNKVPFRAGRLKSYALRNKFMGKGVAKFLTLALG